MPNNSSASHQENVPNSTNQSRKTKRLLKAKERKPPNHLLSSSPPKHRVSKDSFLLLSKHRSLGTCQPTRSPLDIDILAEAYVASNVSDVVVKEVFSRHRDLSESLYGVLSSSTATCNHSLNRRNSLDSNPLRRRLNKERRSIEE